MTEPKQPDDEGTFFESLIPLRIPAGWSVGRNNFAEDSSHVEWDPLEDDVELLNLVFREKVMVELGIAQSVQTERRYWIYVRYIDYPRPFRDHMIRNLTRSDANRELERVVRELTVDLDAFRK